MIDPLPRPRVLFEDVPDDVFDTLKTYAPTSQRISTDGNEDEVHDSDWDLFVSFADSPSSHQIPHNIFFGAVALGYTDFVNETRAAELRISDDAPEPVRRLVRSTVVPAIPAPVRSYWMSRNNSSSYARAMSPHELGDGYPLLTAGKEEMILAFWRIRRGSHTLVLPRGTLTPDAWLRHFIDTMQSLDTSRFPPGTAWRDTIEWAPPQLKAAHSTLNQIEDERARLLEDLETRELDARDILEQERLKAEDSWWKLLTASGDPLTSAVRDALIVLGFEVEDRDRMALGAKLEDLRVTDPSSPGWVCLTEVKGYTRGAKSNDVLQVATNPSVRFAVTEGRQPDKLWHVVNPERETSPSRRRPTFSDPDAVLASFRVQNGLVIDTRDLTRAVYAVLEDPSAADTVRQGLRESTGLWSWPESTTSERNPD